MKNGLLLGAGFSYDLGMPLTAELTEVFLNLFTDHEVRRLEAVMSIMQPFGKDRPIDPSAIKTGFAEVINYQKKGGKNYEEFLAGLQHRAGLGSPTQSERDSYHYLFDFFYQIIHIAMSLYQEISYDLLYGRNSPCFANLKAFLSTSETWVLSLNHDLNFEYLALDLKIPITYGDDHNLILPVTNLDLSKTIPFSYTERKGWTSNHLGFLKDVPGFNLIKLHGGLGEFSYRDDSLLCNLQIPKPSSKLLADDFKLFRQMSFYEYGEKVMDGRDCGISDLSGKFDIIRRSMLTGGKKYSGTSNVKDGEEKLQILDSVLLQLDELTVIGYGFGDEHINFRLSNAMLLNKKLRIIIVDPHRVGIPLCLQQFDYDARVRLANCAAPLWLDYRETSTWNYTNVKILKDNEHVRAEIRKNVERHLKLA